MMFSETKLTERVQSGFKKSIKEGKWKEMTWRIDMIFRFYSKGNGESLEDFKQGSDMFMLSF